MGSPVEIDVPVPSNLFEQVIANWEGVIVIFRLKPGVYGALGADGDIVENVSEQERPRWTVKTVDGQTFRAFPMLAAELEGRFIPAIHAANMNAVVIEDMKPKED